MQELTAILIDDEIHCTETLAWQLETYCPSVRITAICNSSAEGLQAIQNHHPDVVFLDIEMPVMNGFDLLKQLPSLDFQLIFTTAYNDFAIEAFQVSATDYLLKPIQRDLLVGAVEKISKRSIPQQREAQLEILQNRLAQPSTTLPVVALPTFEGLEFVETESLMHCESDNNYCKIYLADGKTTLVSRPMKEMESMLKEQGFIRIHNSHLVNVAFLQRYVKGDGGYVVLKNGTHLNVSRSRKADLLDFFK